MSQVLRHVVEAIGPASRASAEAARARVASAGAPLLERLAHALGGAQHTARPRTAHRMIVVAIGDHGCGDPGVALGRDHPTVASAHAIADGSAALCGLARAAAQTPIVLVDAGAREPDHLPGVAIRLDRQPSRDSTRGPAMTPDEATRGLEAGVALAISLSERALDLVVIGAIGVGAEVGSAALLAAVTGHPPVGLGDEIAEAAGVRGSMLVGADGVALLASFGGPETAVLAGLILGAASMNIPVILDGYATGAAALVAARLAPLVTGYLLAAHRGGFTQPAILAHLGITPTFEVGLGHGEGTGGAILLPLVDQVAAVAAEG